MKGELSDQQGTRASVDALQKATRKAVIVYPVRAAPLRVRDSSIRGDYAYVPERQPTGTVNKNADRCRLTAGHMHLALRPRVSLQHPRRARPRRDRHDHREPRIGEDMEHWLADSRVPCPVKCPSCRASTAVSGEICTLIRRRTLCLRARFPFSPKRRLFGLTVIHRRLFFHAASFVAALVTTPSSCHPYRRPFWRSAPSVPLRTSPPPL